MTTPRAFVGRTQELQALAGELELVSASGEGRFVWMYGRRRVGKSRLVQELVESVGAPYVFYQAPRRPHPDGLRRFLAAVAESTLPAGDALRGGASADTWVAALRLACQGATSQRPAIVVIDELPYLLEADPGIAADIQQAWDQELSRSAVLLICVGSDMRMMRSLTDHPAELFGRPTREMHLRPFSPRAVGALLGADPADAFDRYAIVGGFPQLARTWTPGLSRSAYLERTLSDPASPLVVDGLRILDAELPSELQAKAVLEAIGHGERTFTGISNDSGVSNHSSLNNALKTLQRKRLVDVEVPSPSAGRTRRYVIADPYLRFWLRFVGPSLDEIDRGRGELVAHRIERDWSAYCGRAIEPIVRRSIERMLPDDRFGQASHVGSYWTRSQSVEVDLVGTSDARRPLVAFVGSVKWRERRPFGRDDLASLIEQRPFVPGGEQALLVGVSRSGFAKDVSLDVSLSPAELIAAWPDP